MKKIFAFALVAAMVATGCTNKQKVEEAQAAADASKAELVAAVADRDELLNLVNEISGGMEQIKQLENILSVSGTSETPGQREQIKADIAAIQQTLQERRQKLADLESKLSKSSIANANLKKTIASLNEQIDTQAAEIGVLRQSLGEAQETISTLVNKTDSLNNTVNTVTAALDSTATKNTQLTNELNLCYYAIGTKSELKDNGIIETGFLKKTKVLEGDFNREFFTVADKRTFTTLDLGSNKAEVLTNQPESSYVIVENGGHKTLRVTNPAAFWSLTNYLVIKID